MSIKIYKLYLLIWLILTILPAEAGLPIPKGYILAQQVSTFRITKYGGISSATEAEKLFYSIKGKVNGVEFVSLFYDEKDLEAHRTIAKIGKKYQVHLWASSYKLLQRMGPATSLEYQAWVMEPNGRIKPAVYQGDRILPDGTPIFDLLNPKATDWFINKYKETYLQPLKGFLNGFFFNEDAIPYLSKWSNNNRYDYWHNAAYSPAVLEQWRKYCKDNRVLHDGKIVDKFPVHRREMVSQGSGMTAYFPGYDIPEKIYPGQRFTELPRAKGVWQHWYNFLAKIFTENWLGKLAAAANQVNENNPEWIGVVYFNIFPWSLSYEEIKNNNLRVPLRHKWGAWGKQRGIDLALLSRNPEIKGIICETYPPLSANLELFIVEFQRIVRGGNKVFGLMLHRDDRWPLDLTEEKSRWQLIEKLQPTIIARYPLKHMLPGDRYYHKNAEDFFNKKWREYYISTQ